MHRSLTLPTYLRSVQLVLIPALLLAMIGQPSFAKSNQIDNLGHFGKIAKPTQSGFGLSMKDTNYEPLIADLLKENFATNGWGAKRLSESEKFRSKIINYRLTYLDLVFCDYGINVHALPSREPTLSGQLPRPTAEFDTLHQPSLLTTKNIVGNQVQFDTIKFIQTCWHEARQNQFEKVFEYLVTADHIARRMRVSTNHIVLNERLVFDTTAETKIFERNPKNNNLVSTTIPDMVGDGSLSGHYFTTIAGPNSNRAQSGNHQFIYTPEAACPSDISAETQCYDANFMEASLYTNAVQALQFFCALGFTDPLAENACEPSHPEFEKKTNLFQLHFGARYNGDVNTAFYTPGDPPTIRIGDGDGNQLQALGVERDVVIHEFSHHVIYKYLKALSGQSKELHEGISDFFAVSFNNDPCFAPSICPQDSTACYKVNECLRSASTDLSFNDEDLPSSEHLKGQIISGMLWDLISSNAISKDVMTQLTFDSLVHLSPTGSSRAEFVFALLLADLNQPIEKSGCFGCAILAAGIKRGLVAEGVLECDEELANACIKRSKELEAAKEESSVLSKEIDTTPPEPTPSIDEPVENATERKWYQCATLGLPPGSGGEANFLLLLPLVIRLRKSKKLANP